MSRSIKPLNVFSYMFVVCTTILTMFAITDAHAQVVINEVEYCVNDRIEIKNLGSSPVDISSWWLCSLFVYAPISGEPVIVMSGSTTLAPNDIVVLSGFSMNNTAADLGLYNSRNFPSAAAMEAFVQWGRPGLGIGREGVAVNKGIWTAGDFVPTVACGNSIEYDGNGNASTDWFDQAVPTFGNNNSLAFGQAVVSIDPATQESPETPIPWTFSPVAAISPGEEFTVDLTVENITDLAGWESDIRFDPAALEVIQVQEGEFLKQQETRLTFWQPGVIDNAIGEVTDVKTALLGAGGVTGIGTVLTIIFKAKQVGESIVELQDLRAGDSAGQPIPYETIGVTITVTAFQPWDINQDRLIDIFDLILVAQSFNMEEPSNPRADVNKDGLIDIFDLVLVARHFGESTTSGAPVAFQKPNTTHAPMIQHWLATARQANDGSIAFKRGIAVLERLLSVVAPRQTALFLNYPNPFNPETWIPYQLSHDATVQIKIYDIRGALVRQLNLGHQQAGHYVDRERAAYWSGRDENREQVSSGLYFYQLRAGEFSATKRMVILK